MTFERRFNKITDLENEPLYSEKLKEDILSNALSKKVFPAIRKNEIHFYYKGGRLFKYSGKSFKTHLKYAFVCDDDVPNGDVDITKLTGINIITDFRQGYERIKERCALYNKGLESYYVSKLFKKYSYVTSKENIVLLDIEAALTLNDRTDMVLYDKKNQIIKFVEAKLYSNGELSASQKSNDNLPEETSLIKEDIPKVINQIQKYEEQIEKKESEIKTAYKNYIEDVNNLFADLNLPSDNITISKKVGLIFFDFNGNDLTSDAFNEKKRKLKEHINEDNIYAIGDTENASLSQLFCNNE